MERLFGDTVPTVINDPFKSECIRAIHMHANKSIFGGEIVFYGSVVFENENTEGEQKFKADSFDELYISIAEFCKSLT